MSNISEYVNNLQILTKRNLEILKGLNQAFYTKADYIRVDINDEQYIIPSFISLESKINSLEDNFNQLVNAPKTGDAVFDFNGNTQKIEVKGYSNTPKPVFDENTSIDDIYTEFSYKDDKLFDLCTPQPFVKIDISSIPTDIQQVNVRKIVLKSDVLKDQVNKELAKLACKKQLYSDVVVKLYDFEKGKDYIVYDKVYDLPVRDNIGVGTYKILSVDSKLDSSNLDFIKRYNLKLDGLFYYVQEETLQKKLVIGDNLVTNNDRVRLVIEDINYNSNEITVCVADGGYADLTRYDQNIDLGTLKYLPPQDWNSYKFVNIPLEEDQYIYIFIAPIERTSKIQSNWSYGILFNVFNLSCNINGNVVYYKDYYDKFVYNIGDTIYGIASLFDKSFLNINALKYKSLLDYKPVIDGNSLKVVEIDKHLYESENIEKLYDLYNQKQNLKQELENINKDINDTQSKVNGNFYDRKKDSNIYSDQIQSLNDNKVSILENLNTVMTDISNIANDSVSPVSNPKYRVRGFFNYKAVKDATNVDVVAIDCQYRYRNIVKETGQAITITGDDIFSDWNQCSVIYNKRRPVVDADHDSVSYDYDGDSTNINEISFNQIDIPIQQGEKVDIRLRCIYSTGQPFVETMSSWSDIYTIEFPEELYRDITVLDIIQENNTDIKNNQYDIVLKKYGIIDHVEDSVIDQNITFFHNPLHISSGFYTDERRIIPLFDKLKDLTDQLLILQDEVHDTNTNNLTVSVISEDYETNILPFINNRHVVSSYISNTNGADGYAKTSDLCIYITNKSSRTVRIYSIFPNGDSKECININSKCKYDVRDYITSDTAVYFVEPTPVSLSSRTGEDKTTGQLYNQLLYFRLNKISDGTPYYIPAKYSRRGNYLLGTTAVSNQPSKGGSTLFPMFSRDLNGGNSIQSTLCIPNSSTESYIILKPNDSIQVPIRFLYNLDVEHTYTEKTISFDIRTSLYRDPTNYTITVGANYRDLLKKDQAPQSDSVLTNNLTYKPMR